VDELTYTWDLDPERVKCRVCNSESLRQFFEVRGIPTQTTVLLDSESEARQFPTGDLRLSFCEACGFIQNDLFDPDLVDYSLPTEESQAYSPLFTDYAASLADRLVEELDLRGCEVLEVGSGKGEFLALLAERGIGHGLGIDPGFLPGRAPESRASLEFRREFYGPSTENLTGRLVLARHLLEHIPNVTEFLRLLARSLGRTKGSTLFIEVPDTGRILREGAFWDVYYEHCSYFTPGTMSTALKAAGLTPNRIELGFQDQYILSWAGSTSAESEVQQNEAHIVRTLSTEVDQFSKHSEEMLAEWRTRIGDEAARGARVVLWGASSKTVSLVSALDVNDVVVVDINPHKQGKWLPGVGLEVIAPSQLSGMSPSLIVPMNPIYTDEISNEAKSLGLSAEIRAIG
jgi:hypothetical protein